MRARQIMRSQGFTVAIAFNVLTVAIPYNAEPSVLAGKAFALANCSHCRSIDKFTQSSLVRFQ